MDISTIAAAIGSVKSAADIVKFLKDTGLSLEKAEVKLKLSDLYNALADARMQIADVQDLLREKDTKIRELEEALAVKAALVYEAPYYWQTQGNKKEGPFCQQCYDANGKLIRLQGRKTKGSWGCMTCEKIFQDKIYREPDRPPIRGRLV